jgi:hypothetical protein
MSYHGAMKRFFGTILVLVALMFAGGSLSSFFDAAKGTDVSSSIGGGFITLALAAIAGYYGIRLFRPSAAKHKKPNAEQRERLALTCAAASGGKLTEASLSLDSGLSLDESKKLLDSLASRGVAELEVSSSGALVYAFPGLISEGEKLAAKPVEEA